MPVEGLDQVLGNIDAVERQMLANIERAMAKAMDVLLAEYRRQMKAMIYDTPESPNYQRTYRLYTEAFAAAAAALSAEIVRGVVWNEMPYSIYVELGTIYVPARPCLQAAVEAAWDDILDVLGDVLDVSGAQRPAGVVFGGA
jgi:hypothetical protein